jgi:hypothetical protein
MFDELDQEEPALNGAPAFDSTGQLLTEDEAAQQAQLQQAQLNRAGNDGQLDAVSARQAKQQVAAQRAAARAFEGMY